jgi:hypothetical protein
VSGSSNRFRNQFKAERLQAQVNFRVHQGAGMHKEDAHVALPGASLNGPTDNQIDEVLSGGVVSAFMGNGFNGLNFIDALDRFPYTQLSLCGPCRSLLRSSLSVSEKAKGGLKPGR